MPSPTFAQSRRDFFRTAAAGGAILTLPPATYRAAFAADAPPSERVRVGMIGVGNQGNGNLGNCLKNKLAVVTAVCDVDADHLGKAAANVEKSTGTMPLRAADFRRLLDSKDVDAVVVSTPDHWHALPTIEACKAGKDAYTEKPLTLFVDEGKAMVKAARDNNRVVQTGSQQRSGKEFRKACELVRSGAVGKVHTVKVGLPGPNWVERAKEPVADSVPPAALDYERWLGPAPQRPFNEKHVHYLFRFYWDYAGGQMTNWGAHHLDIAQWGLGMDETGPVSVEGTATFNDKKWFETPESTRLTYTYANGVKVLCSMGGKGGYPGGTTFVGDKGSIFVTRGKLTADPTDALEYKEVDVRLYESDNHFTNFFECVKSRKRPICDVAVGHRSATVCHLGNIVARVGRKIVWDPAKEEIVGDAEAAKLLTREYRKPWVLG
jgi:predicted dehydrogenase